VLALEDPVSSRTVQVPTEVVEAPPFTFDGPFDPTAAHDPAPGGVQIAAIQTGTLGGWVWSRADDSVVLLSAAHVLEAVGLGVDQPASAKKPMAEVTALVELVTKPGVNTVDCAIAEPYDSDAFDLRVPEIGPGVYAIADGVEEMEVEKYGQATEHTEGEIKHEAFTGVVSGSYLFKDCLLVRSTSGAWAKDGDSGALVFHDAEIDSSGVKPAVGLHFASSGDTGKLGIACKISNVFADLDLDTICSGVFEYFLEILFEAEITVVEAEPGVEPDPHPPELIPGSGPPAVLLPPIGFTARARTRASARRLHAGIAREVEERLRRTAKGRVVADFVQRHRAELANLLVHEGDVRRALIMAVGPVVAGVVTTSELFERRLSPDDLERLERLAAEVARAGSARLKRELDPLLTAYRAIGKGTLARFFGMRK
jgi:hypothetical protein